MRLYLPVGGGAYAHTGCITTPAVLLVYVVFWGAVAMFWVAYWMLAGMVLVLAWTAFGALWLGWQVRFALARHKAALPLGKENSKQPRDGPPDSPARWSNRR